METMTKDQVARFKSALTPDLVKRRPGPGGKMLDYIEWVTAADMLDEIAPDWSHQIKSIQIFGEGSKAQVAVIVALTVSGVTREGVGVDWLADEQGIKSAEHDALKRAAVKFGIGRDLYRGQEGMQNIRANAVAAGESAVAETFPAGAPSRSLSGSRSAGSEARATEKQLEQIRKILTESRDLLSEEEAKRVESYLDQAAGDGLTRSKASEILDYFLGSFEKNEAGQRIKTREGHLDKRRKLVRDGNRRAA